MHTRFTCGGCLALLLLVAPLAVAQDSERNRFFVQQMIELAADGNAQGVDTMQRMLEQNPKPAATDAEAARAALRRGQEALAQDDNTGAALSAFLQASRDDPGNLDAFSYLGLSYRKLGQLSDAERALQIALSLDPSRAVAWFQLAQVYGLQNDQRRARGALANTYRYAQNPMRAEEILRSIAETETAEPLRNAALETLRLYQLPALAVIVPPIPVNPDIQPLNPPSGARRP
ncbi:MAG TPA: tetratricopeptide repeat protein [Candidatus Competibacteraceae bacterium]|nr:MAG: tetratricopeptide repeat protein [Candidatus Competibacteraceae bacterium]HNW77439.1 tetratricopeptide repeat protein [Candidatus Competibacteraceae bacterium]HQC71584.1 tetratricopeptide repeat protein [Candidatus Competibacteraceae bacterium]